MENEKNENENENENFIMELSYFSFFNRFRIMGMEVSYPVMNNLVCE